MRIFASVSAALLLAVASNGVLAACTEVCDDFGCRLECPDKFRIQRIGKYFQIEIPKADLELLKDISQQMPAEAVLNAKRNDGGFNILIMSVPQADAEKILERLAPSEPNAKLPR